jgi:hypothetical protein
MAGLTILSNLSGSNIKFGTLAPIQKSSIDLRIGDIWEDMDFVKDK